MGIASYIAHAMRPDSDDTEGALKYRLFSILGLFAVPGVALCLFTILRYEPVDGNAFFVETWLIPTTLFIVLSGVILYRIRRGIRNWWEPVLFVLACLFLVFSWFIALLLGLNGLLDRSQPRRIQTVVVKKTRGKSRKDPLHIYFAHWDNPSVSHSFAVNGTIWKNVTPGKTLFTAVTRKGYFHYEWFVRGSISIHDPRQEEPGGNLPAPHGP